MMNVARMEHHRTVLTRKYPLDVILREIRTGKTTVIESDPVAELAGGRSLRHATEFARRLLSDGKKDGYDAVKKSLPAFTPAGFSSDGSRDIDTLTGCVCLEWDDLDDPAWAFSELAQSPLTLAVWYSFSGCPKALFRVDPLPSHDSFEEAWYAAAVEFEELGDPDLTSSRHSQAQALVFSPELHYNPNAQVITFDPESHYFVEAFPTAHTDADFAALAALPSEYQALIVDLEFDGDGHCKTRVPCPSTHHENDSFENLRANATMVSRREDGSLHFHCFKCGKTKVFAKNGVRKLVVDADFQRETASLESEQLSVAQELSDWDTRTKGRKDELLNMTTAAGTGKSTACITTIDNLLYIARTTEEADQAFSISEKAGKDGWQHRPRTFNVDHENAETLSLGLASYQRPCYYPAECNDLAKRGHSPTVKCYTDCAYVSRCRACGHLSQEKIERNKQQVFYSWDESNFSDRRHAERVRKLVGSEKVLVCDEGVPSGLPMERNIRVSELAELAERWRVFDPVHHRIWTLLKPLTEKIGAAVSSRDFYDAVSPIADLSADDIRSYDEKLALLPLACVYVGDGMVEVIEEWSGKRLRVEASALFHEDEQLELDKLTYKFVSGFTYSDLGLLDYRTIPRVYPSLFRDFSDFVKGSRAETAPCHREGDDWFFYLPPGMNADRGILMSASDTADHVREVYRGTGINVETITGKPPVWRGGCWWAQLDSGRYTLRQGLLHSDGSLRKQAVRMVELIRLTAEVLDKKCLVVAQTAFIESDGLQCLRDHPNVTLINHHHAEGRNDYQDRDVVFVFHFEPSPEVIESQARRIYRNASDLSFERQPVEICKDGVSLIRERYIDERVQEVYDRECSARLMQCLLRLRQHRNENKTGVLFTAEPVGGLPMAPVPFSLSEAERCLFAGEAWEGLIAVRQETDVEGYAAATGQSERTAYRKTTEARQESTADEDAARDAEILRILQRDPKTSVREIERLLKAAGHSRTHHRYISQIVADFRRG